MAVVFSAPVSRRIRVESRSALCVFESVMSNWEKVVEVKILWASLKALMSCFMGKPRFGPEVRIESCRGDGSTDISVTVLRLRWKNLVRISYAVTGGGVGGDGGIEVAMCF
jgi:hypothetical protein